MAVNPIDVAPKHVRTVRSLLARHLPNTEAWAYGSRVRWTSRPASDLDVVVFANPEQARGVASLREAFEESDLPFRVDLSAWQDVPESFRQQIEQEHVKLCRAARPPTPKDMGRRYPAQQVSPFRSLFAEPTRNGLTRPKAVRGSGVKMVKMGEMFAHPRLKGVAMDRVPLDLSKESQYLLQDRDLLFARQSLLLKGAGKCSIFFSDNELTTFESHVIRVRLNPSLADPLYYYYYWQSPQGRSAIRSIVEQGAGASGIRATDLATLPVACRPAEEQRAVARTLGVLDEKIELNRRMNETLEAKARALFKSWFVDFEPVLAKMSGRATGLPDQIADLFPSTLDDEHKPFGWSSATLAALAKVNPESWSSRNIPERVDYVDLANTKWGTIEGIRRFTWEEAPSRARRILRPGDTIVGTERPGNGSFAFIGVDGLTGSTGFAVLRPHQRRDRAFVFLAATALENIERLAQLADGAAYPAVRPQQVCATRAVVPDDSLMCVFSDVASPVLERIESNRRQNDTLARIRDLLLPKLISGEIRVSQAKRAVEAVTGSAHA